jgi:hypothetical protein
LLIAYSCNSGFISDYSEKDNLKSNQSNIGNENVDLITMQGLTVGVPVTFFSRVNDTTVVELVVTLLNDGGVNVVKKI